MKRKPDSQPRLFLGIITILGLFVALAIVFGLGVFIGEKRANFSFKWAQEYHKNFGGPASGFLGNILSADFASANGVFGQIIKIDNNDENKILITIAGSDNFEKIIVATYKTAVRVQNKSLKISDLKIFDHVVIIGSPNAVGQTQAVLIRIMPEIEKNNYPIQNEIPDIIAPSGEQVI